MEMGEVIPAVILNRISAVLIELNEEMKRLEKLKIELNQKSEQTKERFKHDSVMLGQLFSWFKLIFGKKIIVFLLWEWLSRRKPEEASKFCRQKT